ncbi:MAG: protein kinase [Pirellulales bacterium]|nr:protein kinase [Pirellulales bacterium]
MAELKTFLFTDICRSVDLKNEMAGRSVTERDLAFIETILTPHRQRIAAHLEAQGGRIVSTAGDGNFLVFENTVRAAQWAVDVQRDHRDHPIQTPGGGHVEVRVSIHVGVPQVDPADPNNFVGKSVDYASRLNDYAQGSQILVSRSVMAILHDVGLEDIAFHLHGRRHLKGIGHVEVHELLYDSSSPVSLRQRPASHSDRQWTVLPTEGFDETNRSGPLSDTALAPPHTLQHIGNYELQERLGSGGMGDVYKGRHSQFGRVRAIKVIKPQFVASGNQDVISRFYREIKAVGALEHKNIVVAIDSSAPSDRLHYLVMEYIDGVALLDLVEQLGHLAVADACEVARQAARGLHYIHRNGMVHRDIKPSNLMLALVDNDGMTTESSQIQYTEGVEGVVKILDLGLALLSEEKHDRLTRYDNKAMGTGMYMSPEQWKTTSVDIRADIYSLGCTLYHLLAGNPPFGDSDLRPEKAHEKASVPPIRTGTGIPRKLWDVIQKMLAKKPEDRYATPAEVAAALLPFTEGHNLALLVQEYVGTEGGSSSYRHTRTDSAAKIDTWLSRASHLYPSRRWLVRRGLPLLFVGATIAGLLWMMKQDKEEMIADAMRRERNSLLKFAEEVAEERIGPEFTQWFANLTESATDPKMIKMVQTFDPQLAQQQLAEYPLAKWIHDHRVMSLDSNPSVSWFINDRQGRQIARHPLLNKKGEVVSSFMQNYSYRDYFHGEKKDRPKNDLAGIEPITGPNISAAYVSSSSGKLKVAFSVPIWSLADKSGARTVIGVLSTSFNLGAIDASSLSHSEGKQIVLVDMRDDYLKGAINRGLILSHEHRNIKSLWNEEYQPRVDPTVIQAMQENKDNFVAGYRDPLALKPETTYWGAFEPILYRIPDPESSRQQKIPSGWMVLVQTPAMK